jgi:hypothetical protein
MFKPTSSQWCCEFTLSCQINNCLRARFWHTAGDFGGAATTAANWKYKNERCRWSGRLPNAVAMQHSGATEVNNWYRVFT